MLGDGWHDIRIKTATEELGWPKRFTRVRCTLRPAMRGVVIFSLVTVWSLLAIGMSRVGPTIVASLAWIGTVGLIWQSRRRCRRAVSHLIYTSAVEAQLEPVGTQVSQKKVPAKINAEEAEVCLD